MAKISLEIKTNFAKAQKEIQSLGAVSDRQAEKLKKYSNSFSDQKVNEWTSSNKRAVAAIKAVKGPLAASATNVRNLENKIIGLIKNGINPESRALRRMKNDLISARKHSQGLARSKTALADSARNAGVALAALGAAAGLAAKKTTSAFFSYSEGLANVNSLLPLTAAESKKLDQELTRISETMGRSKKELSDGVYQAVSSGAQDLGSALRVTEQAATLSTAAVMSSEQAVDILTTAMNSYGKETVNAQLASDAFAKTIAEGKIDGQQLSAVIGQSISKFSTAGLSIQELGAALGTLTKLGVKPAEATTALNGAVLAFIAPSRKMQKELKKIGYESGAAFLKAEGFAGAVNFLRDTTQGSVEALRELIPEKRAYGGALVLTSNKAKEFNAIMSRFQDVSGATDEAFKKQTKGLAKSAFQFKQFKTVVLNTAIGIGKRLAPSITAITEKIRDFIVKNRDAVEAVGAFAIKAGILAASLGGLLIVAIKIKKAFAVVQGAITGMKILTNPYAAIIAGIALVIGATVLIVKNWEKVKEFLSQVAEKVGDAFKNMAQNISDNVSNVGKFLGDIFQNAKERVVLFAERIGVAFKLAFAAIRKAANEVSSFLPKHILGAVSTVLEALEKIPGMGKLFSGASDKVDSLMAESEARKILIQQEIDLYTTLAEEQKNALKSMADNIDAAKFEGWIWNKLDGLELPNFETVIKKVEITESSEGDGSEGGGSGGSSSAGASVSASARKIKAGSLGYDTLSLGYSDTNVSEQITQQKTFMELLREEIKIRKEQVLSLRDYGAVASNIYRGLQSTLASYFTFQKSAIEDSFTRNINAIEERRQKEIAAAEASILDEDALEAEKSRIDGKYGEIAEAQEKKKKKAMYKIQLDEFNTNKVFKLADAIMTGAQAVLQALTLGPFAGPIAAAIIGGLTAVQVGFIAAQKPPPPPSFELGGRFTVPDGPRPDGVGLRVNPGEEIEVAPRGQSLSRELRVIAQIENRIIWDVVNEGIEYGEITIRGSNIA